MVNQVDLKKLKQSFPFFDQNYSLVNYLDLNIHDSERILEFRNHLTIRTRMVKGDIISIKEHLSFISSLNNKKVGYWVLKSGFTIIGSISLVDYNEKEKSFIGGSFLSPEFIGTGKGIILNYFIHKLAFEIIQCDSIKAIVKKDNSIALRMNKLFGSIIIKEGTNIESDYLGLEFFSKYWFDRIKNNVEKLMKYA